MASNDLSELKALDITLGVVISSTFDELAQNGTKDYKEFLSRPIKEKIFRADHEDAGGLARKIVNAGKGQNYTVEPQPLEKKPVLPLVGYYRKPGMNNGDVYAKRDKKTVWNNDLSKTYDIARLPVSLNYSMTFAAWDIPTLDKMQLAWYYYVINYARFAYPVLIADETQEVMAKISDPKSLFFSDTSPLKQSFGRIYSVSIDLTVVTEVLVGEAVDIPNDISFETYIKYMVPGAV